jgi:hypothetical protein
LLESLGFLTENGLVVSILEELSLFVLLDYASRVLEPEGGQLAADFELFENFEVSDRAWNQM